MNLVAKFVLVVMSFLESASEVSTILASPHNLSLQTMNTQYILKWEWEPQTPANERVTFTAQYLPMFKIRRKKQDWKLGCNATVDMQCDFTHSQIHYQGIYVLRVRADSTGESSEWVQTEFCPDQDAKLGPPTKVDLIPGNGLLRVWISDPVTSGNVSMREMLMPSLYFSIQYWKQTKNAVTRGGRILETSNNHVTLLDLQRWTIYCVKVRSHFDFYNKTSHFSPAVCMKTSGQVPVWLIILALLPVSAVLWFGLYRLVPLVKSTFFPSAQLPIRLYTCDSPHPDWSCLLAAEAQVEVFCEKLEVFPKETPAETQAPRDPPEPGRRGSRDSGVYSSSEGSGQQGGGAFAQTGLAAGQANAAGQGTGLWDGEGRLCPR